MSNGKWVMLMMAPEMATDLYHSDRGYLSREPPVAEREGRVSMGLEDGGYTQYTGGRYGKRGLERARSRLCLPKGTHLDWLFSCTVPCLYSCFFLARFGFPFFFLFLSLPLPLRFFRARS